MSCPPIWRVAVPAPINRLFDYRKPVGQDHDNSEPKPGIRVRVPFGRGQAVGVVTATATATDVPEAIPPFSTTVDDDSRISGGNILGRWTREVSPSSAFTLQGYRVRDSHLARKLAIWYEKPGH